MAAPLLIDMTKDFNSHTREGVTVLGHRLSVFIS